MMKRSVSVFCALLCVFFMGQVAAVETSTAGSLEGNFGVSNGAANYSIPIAVPAGTTGVQPDLALSYSGRGGSNILGAGWGLGGGSMSSISECPKTIAQDGIVSGALGSGLYCLDGIRIIAINGEYGAHGTEYRTEIDSGVKVVSYYEDNQLSFRVWTKAGLLKEYGRTTNSQIRNSKGIIISWSVEKIIDTMGNYMVYEYYQPADKSYSVLSKISYTGNENTGLAPYAYVEFNYINRQDNQFHVYHEGAKYNMPVLLDKITSYIKDESSTDTFFREYRIGYSLNEVYPSKQSVVNSIKECFSTAADDCVAATTFDWDFGQQISFSSSQTAPGLITKIADSTIDDSCEKIASADISRIKMADFNGDGRTDIYYVKGLGGAEVDEVYLTNPDGTFTPVQTGLATFVDGSDDWAASHINSIMFGDFNGDGYADMYHAMQPGSDQWLNDYIHLGNGDGTFQTAQSNVVTKINGGTDGWTMANADLNRIRIADLNGDGRSDVYYMVSRGELAPNASMISNGDGTFTYVNSGIYRDIAYNDREASRDIGRENFGDFNGDGILDIYAINGHFNNPQYDWIYFGNGDGTFKSPVTTDMFTSVDDGFGGDEEGEDDRWARVHMRRIKFGDFNGDGLTDLFYIQGWDRVSKNNTVHLSRGDGTFEHITSNVMSWLGHDIDGAEFDVGRQMVMDINGDGLSDIYETRGWNSVEPDLIWFGKGNGTFAAAVYSITTRIQTNNCASIDQSRTIFGDFDGDADLDIYYVEGDNAFIGDTIYYGQQKAPKLTKITNGSGVEIDIAYKKLTDSSVYEIQPGPATKSQYPNIEMTTAMDVVSRVGTSDGVGGKNYRSYKYYDLKTNKEGRGSLGFGKIEVLDETTLGKVVTEYNQTWPFAGMQEKSETYVYKDGAYVRISFNQSAVRLGTAEGELPIRIEPYYGAATSFTLDGEELATTITEQTYDEYGNVLQVKQTIIDYTDPSRSMHKITDNIYDNFPSKWHMGRLRRAQVTHKLTGYADKVKTTEYTYDLGTGLLEREIVEPDNPELYAKTEYTRDAYGNVTKTKTTSNKVSFDANGGAIYTSSGQAASLEQVNTTNVTLPEPPSGRGQAAIYSPYIPLVLGHAKIVVVPNPKPIPEDFGTIYMPPQDPDPSPYDYPQLWGQYQQVTTEVTSGYGLRGRFPTWSQNQLGHTETYVYDQVKGVKISQTGPNGNTGTWIYDDLIRLVQVNSPDGTWAKTSYHRRSDAYPFMVKTTDSKGAEGVVYQDILRRDVISQAKDLKGDWKVNKKVYSHKGLIERDYPVFTPATQISDYTTYDFSQEDRYIEPEYDELSRPVKSKLWHGVEGRYLITETIYEKGKTTTINAKGQKKVSYTDVVTGNMTAVEEHNGAQVYTSQYRYDIDGNLLETEDTLGNITVMHYDTLGRKVAMDDKDLGHWEYRYNAFGKLVWQKDAKGQLVTFIYDELGRMQQRSEPESVTQWIYDTRANGIGKLAYITKSNNGYREDVYYDSLGRIQTTTTTIDGVSYTTTSTYDSHGRPDTFTYPTVAGLSNVVVKNHYHLGSKAYKQTDATTGALHWELQEADEEHSKVVYGNGLQTVKTFDKYTSFLKGIDTGFYSEVQSLRYEYDDIGNVISREDNNQNLEENFGYDGLNRLTSYHVNGFTARTVNYDAIGNITYKSDVGTYQYNSTKPHAVTHTGNKVHSYDANGNLYDTRIAGTVDRSVTWTSFNKPTSMTQNGVTATYTYGAGHNRITKTKGNKKTTYVGSMYEKEVEGATTKHTYYVGSIVIKRTLINGSLTSESKNYMHKDHQGSTDVITDENGYVVERQSFDAWGKRRQSNNWQDAQFSITSDITSKGYTGHEMDDEFDLVNMKGRIYDPTLGRFMSADPFVQQPANPQNFNRYAYVLNNPLKYTDPSGFFFSKIAKAIRDVVDFTVEAGPQALLLNMIFPNLGTAYFFMKAAASSHKIKNLFLKNKYAIQAGTIVASFFGPTAVAGFNSFATRIQGGNSKMQAKAFAISYVSAKLSKGIGDKYAGQTATKMLLHGLVGGTASAANGGKFGHGFISGAASGGSEDIVFGIFGVGDSMLPARVVVAAVIGGTASALGGGKFANGAVTATFVWMFNAEDPEHKKQHRKYSDVNYESNKALFGIVNNREDTVSVALGENKFSLAPNQKYGPVLIDAVDMDLIITSYDTGEFIAGCRIETLDSHQYKFYIESQDMVTQVVRTAMIESYDEMGKKYNGNRYMRYTVGNALWPKFEASTLGIVFARGQAGIELGIKYKWFWQE